MTWYKSHFSLQNLGGMSGEVMGGGRDEPPSYNLASLIFPVPANGRLGPNLLKDELRGLRKGRSRRRRSQHAPTCVSARTRRPHAPPLLLLLPHPLGRQFSGFYFRFFSGFFFVCVCSRVFSFLYFLLLLFLFLLCLSSPPRATPIQSLPPPHPDLSFPSHPLHPPQPRGTHPE